MTLLQRFRLARALRHLGAIFETLSRLPRMAELQSEGLHGLPMYGQLQASRWKNQLALYDRHHVTRVLLSNVKQAKRRGDAQAHSALIALWHALAADGVASSATDWMYLEFGFELPQRSSWITSRYP
jgi:hypothetical protein